MKWVKTIINKLINCYSYLKVIQYTTIYIGNYFAAKSWFLGFEKVSFQYANRFLIFYPDVVRKEADGHYNSVFFFKWNWCYRTFLQVRIANNRSTFFSSNHRSFLDSLCSDASHRGYPTVLPGACDWTAFAERIGRLVEPGLTLPPGSGAGFRCSLFQCGALL